MKSGQVTVSRETVQRMAEVFEANAPLDSAVVLRLTAARRRQLTRQSEGLVRRRYAWVGALAMVCFCGTALGLAVRSGHVRIALPWVDDPAVPVGDAEAPRPSKPELPLGGSGRSVTEELDLESSNQAMTPTSRSPDLRDAKALPNEGPPTPAVRSTPVDRQDGEERSQGDDSSGRVDEQASWQEVAGAMRKGEDARAKDAISPLTASEDAETRDSAELVRLRIELGSRNSGTLHASSSQRARLQRLADDGASATIRASARRLMQRLAPVGVADFDEGEK